ncbi:E3 ubiquitin-protein ligase SH3RF3-like isoform X2 [Planococcus citri]|uniref:E3 ubiquitin-protein ligase SH3RF3-like isoform X2 n=1 Tax=Planococcus citri TaxID=170843 RepID=UPI0031F78764
MDEWTLNDLLECSVCLERLDTYSKVLPCQHTFCKKCLEEIVHTHKELRCPECRVLVEVGIEDLPPNVLLMRILEGMRNGPRRSTSAVHSFPNESVPIAESSKSTTSAFSSQLRVRSRSLNPQGSQGSETHQPHGIAMYDYIAKEPGDLSFKRGDVILFRRKIDNIWYQGECNGVLGVFPLPYVQVKLPLLATYPSHIPQCKALYDFNKCHEDDGCLYFTKGDIITVIRRIDENWAEGKLDDRIGMFPISFVEMNHHAKNLMKASLNITTFSRDPPPTPTEESLPLISTESSSYVNSSMIQAGVNDGASPLSPSSSSSSTATTSPTSSSESTTPSSPSISPSSSQPTNSAAIKRHSFTLGAQPPPYQAPPAVHRHSAEIVKPDDALGCDLNDDSIRNQTEQRIQKSLQLPSQKPTATHLEETPTRQTYHRKKQPLQSGEPQSLNVLSKPVNGNVIENFQRQSSLRISKNSSTPSKLYGAPSLPAMYIAIYPYKPQKTDELELKIGSVYTVIERCQDGWYKGTSHPNQKCGVFPGNYVTPVKSLPMLHAQLRGLVHSSGSPRHDSHTSSEVRVSTPQSKSNLVSVSSPIPAQGNGNISCLAPPELPARSVSPILLFTTSQKNSSTVWHVSCSESLQDKSLTTTVSTAKSRSKNETSESTESSVITSTSAPQKSNGVKPSKSSERSKEKKDKGSVSLMRRLTSMKKSKSPPPTSSYSIDNPVFEDGGSPVMIPVAHARTSDSNTASPSNSKLSKDDKPVISHRKSSSLDTTVYEDRHKNKPVAPLPRERYRCIAPYPPNSEFELELRVDDIIFVHKKREDGWYKGTLQRNGRTGLFPASFVESA